MIGIVVPTRTDAYARRLLRSLATCEPGWYGPEVDNGNEHHRLVFVENGLSAEFMEGIREDELTADGDGERVLFVSPYIDPDAGMRHTALRNARYDGAYPPFVFARAVNIGVEYLHPRADILIMNDDAVFCSPNPISKLEALLEELRNDSTKPCRGCGHDREGHGGGVPEDALDGDDGTIDETPTRCYRGVVRDILSRPLAADLLAALGVERVHGSCECQAFDANPFGVLSLRVEGGVGNPDQMAPLREDQVLETDKAICFVAALIPRAVWDAVGPLDETLVGYGMDDVDWDRRAVNAGYKLGVMGAATVRHVGNPATGEMHGSYSQLGREEHTRLYLLNQQIYSAKWGESGRGDIGKVEGQR